MFHERITLKSVPQHKMLPGIKIAQPHLNSFKFNLHSCGVFFHVFPFTLTMFLHAYFIIISIFCLVTSRRPPLTNGTSLKGKKCTISSSQTAIITHTELAVSISPSIFLTKASSWSGLWKVDATPAVIERDALKCKQRWQIWSRPGVTFIKIAKYRMGLGDFSLWIHHWQAEFHKVCLSLLCCLLGPGGFPQTAMENRKHTNNVKYSEKRDRDRQMTAFIHPSVSDAFQSEPVTSLKLCCFAADFSISLSLSFALTFIHPHTPFVQTHYIQANSSFASIYRRWFYVDICSRWQMCYPFLHLCPYHYFQLELWSTEEGSASTCMQSAVYCVPVLVNANYGLTLLCKQWFLY